MKKNNFFRSSVTKFISMSLVFAFCLFASNTTFAQATPESANKAISQELVTLKQSLGQQQAISLSDATAQAEIAATVKYRFYSTAGDYIHKYGVTQGVQKTYDLFTGNGGTRSTTHVDAARTDLLTLLNAL